MFEKIRRSIVENMNIIGGIDNPNTKEDQFVY